MGAGAGLEGNSKGLNGIGFRADSEIKGKGDAVIYQRRVSPGLGANRGSEVSFQRSRAGMWPAQLGLTCTQVRLMKIADWVSITLNPNSMVCCRICGLYVPSIRRAGKAWGRLALALGAVPICPFW